MKTLLLKTFPGLIGSKILKYLVFPVLSFLATFSYGQTLTTVTGFIKQAQEPKVYLRDELESMSADLVNDTFTFNLMLETAGYYDFSYGTNMLEVYLEPGDYVTIRTVGSNFMDSLVFSGQRHLENKFVQVRNQKRASVYSATLTKIRSYPESRFLNALDSVMNNMRTDVRNFQVRNTVSKSFLRHELVNIDFITANQKGVYGNNYRSNHPDGSQLSAHYNDYLKTLPYDQSSFLPSRRFRDFVRNRRYAVTENILAARPELKNPETSNIQAMFMAIDQLYKDPAVKNYALYTTLHHELRQKGLVIPKNIIEEFNNTCTNVKYREDINTSYYTWTVLSAGNKGPDFSIADVSGKFFSLNDLKGKYVYIDVWATWCGPCLPELTHFDALADQYTASGKISFIKVSLDVNKGAWEKKILHANKNAINLRVENGANSPFAKAYLIKDIPRYLLFDKEGRIIDANALPPSAEKLKKYLADLLAN